MIKIKSMDIEEDLNDIILKFYVNVKNKKRIAFAKEIDEEYYENCFFVVESIIPLDNKIKFSDLNFELFYIGNMEYSSCPYKLNVFENMLLKAEVFVRRKYIKRGCLK